MPNADASVAELREEISRLRKHTEAAGTSEGIMVPASGRLPRSWRHRVPPLARYALAVLLVGLALLTTVTLKNSLHVAYFQTPFFFCAIVLSSWIGGFGAGICSTLLSMILLDFFFPKPLYVPGFSPNDIPRFAIFFFAGAFISWLGDRQRRDEEALLQAREELEEKVRVRTVDLQEANEKLIAEVEERVRQKVRAEARTESVMRANRTIPASLAHLGDTHDVDQLLGEVLAVIAEYLEEEACGIWLYDKEHDRLRLHLLLENGEIKAAHEANHPDATLNDGQALTSGEGYRTSLQPLFKDNAAAIIRSEDIATSPYLAPYRDYLTSRDIQSVVAVPLLAADDFLGMISVRCKHQSSLASDEVAFVQAIAIHASLALKMSRLADVERQAVVAEERQEAVTRHKEALGRIADAGRATLQRLAEHPDLDTFLHHVLAVSVGQFGAMGASIWVGDPSTGICSQCISYRSGDDRRAAADSGCDYPLEPADAAEAEAFRLIPGRIVIHRTQDFETLSPYTPHRATLRELRIQTLIRVPLYFGTEARGILTLKFATDRALSLEEEGLAHTLANQVVLALELTKLSEKAKAVALADERNRMAVEVHDTLAQAFAATLLHLRSMEMEDVSLELRSHWNFAQATAREGLAAARRAMNANRIAVAADARPLAERLADKVQQVAARIRSDTKVRFHLRGQASPFPWAVEAELERIATEALFNAERHAAAREISVNLDYLPENGVRLRVRDDGRGFDEGQPGGAGLGLRSMHDRAERIGASFTLITEVGLGTEIVVVCESAPIPLETSDSRQQQL